MKTGTTIQQARGKSMQIKIKPAQAGFLPDEFALADYCAITRGNRHLARE